MIHLVEKRTGTYAECLEAVGWGTLMEELGIEKVRLVDEGPRFRISGNGDPDFSAGVGAGFWFIVEKDFPAPESAGRVLDYQAERQKEEAQRDFERATKKKGKSVERAGEAGELGVPDPPKPQLRLAKMISSMRKGWNADRELGYWLDEHSTEARRWIETVAGGGDFSGAPNLSNTQLLNPATGKGVSATKSQAKSPGSLPGALLNPFSEWMKLRGMWECMLAYRSGDDLKFMTIEPADISLEGLRVIHSQLEALGLWGGVRLDIEAILRCTEILILNSDGIKAGAPISLRGRRPRSVIQGLHQAYFKSLGTAAALMNDALLPIPEWFRVESREDALAYLAIIREAVGDKPRSGCLSTLIEDNSDEGGVLQQYRSWLTTGDFAELMDFHYEFGVLMMRKAASGDFTRLFRTEILDDLLIRTYEESHMLKEIVENEGFRSVARAIRNTTIYAVSMQNSNREIQFGLAQKWKQKIHSGELSAALGDFVQANNWEVVYKRKGVGHQVTTTDLDQVLGMIEKHGEEKVGTLLLAYGYSRAPKAEETDGGNAELKGQEIASV